MNQLIDTDVFVVGGGPAGLAAALAARSAGLSVTLADIATPPFEKACGEGLMPDAVSSLASVGVRLDPADGAPFEGIRFIDGSRSVAAKFPSGIGIGIRRPVLHRILVDHAREAGVTLLWGAAVGRTPQGEIAVDGNPVQARWIVGADGHKSRVRRWAGLQHRRQQVRYGFRQHYRIRPWSDSVEVYWGTDCQFVITPVCPQEVCVVLMTRDPQLRVSDALRQFPELLARIEGAPASTVERGALSAMLSVESVIRGRCALIGDASGSVDAITGEGLRLAFQQAVCLGKALRQGDLNLYQAEHRRIARLPMFMSRLMLQMDRRAWVRHAAISTLSACPAIFASLLAIHTSSPAPSLQLPSGRDTVPEFLPTEHGL